MQRREFLWRAGIGAGAALATIALAVSVLRPNTTVAPTQTLVPRDTIQPVPLHQEGVAQASAAPTTIRVPQPEAVDTRARAQLRLAIASGMINSPADNEASRAAAQRALRDSTTLDAHDRAIATGYLALAERRFPDACAAFERARRSRETFDAWFGLGECRSRDDAVVLDSAGTPSFRSSYAEAFDAYVKAIHASSSAPVAAYRRMAGVVPQNSGDVRMGRSADNRVYIGRWRAAGDSLGFELTQAGAPRAVSPDAIKDAAEAARIGRERLRPLLVAWARQSPNEPAAHEMLALLLENLGAIAHMGDDHLTAIGEIGRARTLETDPASALRLSITHARLLMRAREHGSLALLIDSVLAAHPDPRGAEAEALMPLALMTGRMRLATNLLTQVSGTSSRAVRGADGRTVAIPPAVVAERADFLVRASLGVCDDRVRSAPRRMISQLDAAFPGGVPRGVESAFMERIVVLALPCVGPSVMTTLREPGRQLLSWVRAFDASDTAFAVEFAARTRGRQLAGPESGMDAVMVDALARLAMKDSVGALQALTLGLEQLPFITRGVFSSEWTVGSTVRGMALAAEVADALGDHETAGRWAPGVADLWKHADAELQAQVGRLRAIAVRTSDSRLE